VQVDVLDGTLFPERSFSDAAAIAAMHLSLSFEAHLMVNDPEEKVRAWIRAGASRIIIHAEAAEHRLAWSALDTPIGAPGSR